MMIIPEALSHNAYQGHCNGKDNVGNTFVIVNKYHQRSLRSVLMNRFLEVVCLLLLFYTKSALEHIMANDSEELFCVQG